MLTGPCLYIVATPIGHLGDISLRALEILSQVDCIAAEDTRHSRTLLTHFAIKTPVIALHAHNEASRVNLLMARFQQKQSVALISDAGTPLISDPGHLLVNTARQHGIPVVPIPGACAFIAALSASGLPCRQFIFEGFLPEKRLARQKKLHTLRQETRTLIFYEAPHRILDLIEDLSEVFGPERFVVIARELTKTFETIYGHSLTQVKAWLQADKNQQRGEFVVLVEGNSAPLSTSDLEIERILGLLLTELPIKQAASLAAKITQQPKNKLYRFALALTGKSS